MNDLKNIIKVKLNTMMDIQDFVRECSTFEEDIDITSGRYVINAKSIMGILSLNLANELTIHINSTDELICEDFQQRLMIYKV